MQKRYFLLMLLFCTALTIKIQALPSCYYTYDQISQLLSNYESQYPDIAKKILIGYSEEDHIPIYAMRITDNVNQDEEEPALLFVGQVHAEEVLGVQTTMSNILEILTNRNQLPYMQWINQLDLWFVPTLNPEGHNVVTSNLDSSYRKNKRDNNMNGTFDFSPLVGYDIDGVDINRNFGFNWVHGDTLLQPGGLEVWDYYRGPAPMSESENQAIKELADHYKFIYSICWHSSRTGNLSEKCYYSFNWKNVRPSPDLAFSASISSGIASHIIKETGTGTYDAFPNLSRQGAFHDWMYQQYGTFQALIECGTSNIQPDSTLMVNTVQRCSNGVRWLINRALPSSQAVSSSSMLTGKIRDAITNEPLEAEIIIQQHNAPWFKPRTSNPTTGRFYRPLASGVYTVQVRKKGYWDNLIPNQMVQNSNWTQIQVYLQPREPAILNGIINASEKNVNARIIIGDVFPDTLMVNGNFIYHGYEGEYPVEIYAEGYFPWKGSVTLNPGENYLTVELSPVNILFSEDWESGIDRWVINGPWVQENTLSVSGYAITDSWGGTGFYAMNCDVWIKTAQSIYIPTDASTMLLFDSHLYTEYLYDPARVEISTDNLNWESIWEKSGQLDYFQKEMVLLDSFKGQNIYLRFHLTDNSTDIDLTDPGWTIDNIQIIQGTATPNYDPSLPSIPHLVLYPSYPNPFNPKTTIRYSLAELSDINLAIYNAKGQLVRQLEKGTKNAGDYQIIWDGQDNNGKDVSSGIYLCVLLSGKEKQLQKMALCK
ncbi:MAG TPA: M14 family zinc carboxypeptidase [Candidatus Syntrophosphaera sp.]|nr:MAG: Carboxypeptidase T precursor [Candidatus Cloacimonetes bacterium ADurb.Bin211]HOD59915.1 M14 family zinc carboxypeptidase [Candidatus Syntrophosphaera sp.]